MLVEQLMYRKCVRIYLASKNDICQLASKMNTRTLHMFRLFRFHFSKSLDLFSNLVIKMLLSNIDEIEEEAHVITPTKVMTTNFCSPL